MVLVNLVQQQKNLNKSYNKIITNLVGFQLEKLKKKFKDFILNILNDSNFIFKHIQVLVIFKIPVISNNIINLLQD